jgi:group I intron endonuclease
MARSCGIYAITHTASGKQYIGSSNSIESRWSVHRSYLRQGRHHSRYLQYAWNKHGEAAFSFTILEETSEDALIEREQYYIDTLNPAYNASRFAGRETHDPEVRRRISEALKGQVFTPERCRRISEGLTGKKLSAAHRRHVSEAQRGRVLPDEWKARISAAMMGNPKTRYAKSDIHKAKMRANMQRKWADPAFAAETRAKLNAARAASSYKKHSAATCQKRGASRKATWAKQKAQGFVHPRDAKGHLLPKAQWPAYFATHAADPIPTQQLSLW